MSPPGDHPAGKHPGKGGSGDPTSWPSSGQAQGSQVTPGLCPAPATRRDQGEQLVSSESSCPGDLNPKQRGRLFSSIIPGRRWQCGEEGNTVTPCGPMPQRWPWPWDSVWQGSCCIPLLPDRAGTAGVQDPGHGGCPSQAFWAHMVGAGLAGDLSDTPDLTGRGDALC